VNPAFPIRPGLAALCLFATILSGCHDASSDPLAVILTEETRSVLAAEANLPSLPRLVEGVGAADELGAVVDRWSGSWELPVEEGRALREELSIEAAEPLAQAIGHAAVSTAVRSVGETLAAASVLKTESLAAGIAENLDRAEAEHAQATAALAEGREGEALGSALEAADLIREVGPESVTRLLLARAEARLESLEVPSEPQPTGLGEVAEGNGIEETVPDEAQIDLERGRRLIRGARLALDEGDFVRAIQRAYYACQVLGLDPND
jgi:hypothetical protein